MLHPTTLLLHGDLDGNHPCAVVNRYLSRHMPGHGYELVATPPAPPDVYVQHNTRYDWRAAPGRHNVFVLHAPLATLLAEQPLLRYRLNQYYHLVLSPVPVDAEPGVTVPVEILGWGTEVQPLPTAPTDRILVVGVPPDELREALPGVHLVTDVAELATCCAALIMGDDWGQVLTLQCLGAGRPVFVSNDIPHLRQLLARLPTPEEVAQTVRHRTWGAVAQQFHERLSTLSSRPRTRRTVPVAYAFFEKGATSWKKYSAHVDACMQQRIVGYRGFSARVPFQARVDQVLVGASEFALEPFLHARQRAPAVRLILHQEGSVLRRRDQLVNDERVRCGLPPLAKSAFEYWRNDMELALADRIVVPSQPARRHFLQAGVSESKLRIVPYGIDDLPWEPPRAVRDRLRFLFVGTDPFRKGIRLLLEAWDALQPRHAELLCVGGQDILQSEVLLRYLVRNPSVVLRPFVSPRRFAQVYRDVDCQVLPSLEDTFSLVIAEGMGRGRPAIVSDETGVSDILTNGVDGMVIPAGSVDALQDALARVCDAPSLLDPMSEACYETARRHGWARFDEGFAAVVEECR
jgi:glycosyltransferase involved in cell wall biosynthesis